jgi:hypothetical protein
MQMQVRADAGSGICGFGQMRAWMTIAATHVAIFTCAAREQDYTKHGLSVGAANTTNIGLLVKTS